MGQRGEGGWREQGKLDFQEVQLVTSAGAGGGGRSPGSISSKLSTLPIYYCHMSPDPTTSLSPVTHLSFVTLLPHLPHHLRTCLPEYPEWWWGWWGSVKECNPKTSSTLNGNVKCETANAKKFSANGDNNIHSTRRLQLINRKLTVIIINWPDIYWHHLLFHICEHLRSERPSRWGQPWVWVFRLVGGRWPECSTSSSVTKLSSQKHPPPPTTAYCPRT